MLLNPITYAQMKPLVYPFHTHTQTFFLYTCKIKIHGQCFGNKPCRRTKHVGSYNFLLTINTSMHQTNLVASKFFFFLKIHSDNKY